MELNIDYVRAQLQRRAAERQLAAVARGCGMTTRTLNYIINGRSGRVDTITALQRYLKDTEQHKRLSASIHKTEKEKA